MEPTADALKELYGIAKPDLRFSSVSVREINSLFDIDIEAENVGLMVSNNVSIRAYDGVSFHGLSGIQPLQPGERKALSFANITLTLYKGSLKLFIDSADDEISKADNVIELVAE